MLCPDCKTEMGKTAGNYQYRECGLDNVWLTDWPMFVCRECNLRLPLMPNAEVATRLITRHLVCEKSRFDGDTILFLRKAMGLKGAELAHILGVTRVEVSRWENDRVAIDPYYDFKLRLEAVDQILPAAIRREVRDEVCVVFHRAYVRDKDVAEKRIDVHIPPELVAQAAPVLSV